MNYIKHLTAFYIKVAEDNRLTSTHISLYMALFQIWNINRFENPVMLLRCEVMNLSKIGSANTYHRCLRELHNMDYIKYNPTHNPHSNSVVYLTNFDTSDDTSKPNLVVSNLRRYRRKSDTSNYTSNDTTYLLYNKHNKQILNKTFEYGQKQNEKKLNFDSENAIKKIDSNSENAKRKKVPPKKEKESTPENIEILLAFFRENKYPELEAHKFFNHYEANGWKVGGKAPMKNWKAAARNWILNSNNFSKPIVKPQINNIHVNNDKDYSIPL